MGKENSALFINCQSLNTKSVKLGCGIAFLVVNTNVKHQLVGSEYPQRREECYKATELVGVKSLRDATMTGLRLRGNKIDHFFS
jgi:galactokinase